MWPGCGDQCGGLTEEECYLRVTLISTPPAGHAGLRTLPAGHADVHGRVAAG